MWGQKHQTPTTKATPQQRQLELFYSPCSPTTLNR